MQKPLQFSNWKSLSIILMGFLILLSLLPLWLDSYMIHVLTICFYYIILAQSWNLLIGYTGLFSLGHHVFAAIGGYTSGLLIHHFNTPIPLCFLATILVTLGLGYLTGILVIKMRSIYLAITTWALAETMRLIITAGYQITRGDAGLHVPTLYRTIEPIPYYYTFLLLMVISLLVMYLVVRSPIGYFMRAIKDDELACSAMGVDTVKWKLFIFSLTSCLAGIAGFFYVHYIGLASPAIMRFDEMGKIVIMVIFGGMGSFVGAIIGAPVVQLLLEYLREFGEWRTVLFALVVLVIMRTNRGGIVNILGRLGPYLREKYNKVLLG